MPGHVSRQLKYRAFQILLRSDYGRHCAEQIKEDRPVMAVVDPYNPTGSSKHISFNTSKTLLSVTRV